jgi:hypothetical protein
MYVTKQYLIWVLCTVSAIGAMTVGIGQALAIPKPCNKIAIIVDGSGSYRNRQAQAVEKAITLLDTLTQAKIHRWEQGDSVALISLDAMPDIIFQGTLKELKAQDRRAWVERFKARSDYIKCTDLVTAFNLAVKYLEGDPRYVKKWIFAFTDLIHEPPTRSINEPKRPALPAPPPEEFPWNGLEDISVSVFWCPINQKLAWQRAIQANQFSQSFAIYTTSESGEVQPPMPPPAKIIRSKAEIEGAKNQYFSFFKTVLHLTLGIVSLILLLPIAIMLFRRYRRSDRVPMPPGTGIGR